MEQAHLDESFELFEGEVGVRIDDDSQKENKQGANPENIEKVMKTYPEKKFYMSFFLTTIPPLSSSCPVLYFILTFVKNLKVD